MTLNMEDLQSQFEQFEVPVNESEWESIVHDPKVVRYNKICRLRRWGLIGGASLVVAAAVIATVVTLNSHFPKQDNHIAPQTEQSAAIREQSTTVSQSSTPIVTVEDKTSRAATEQSTATNAIAESSAPTAAPTSTNATASIPAKHTTATIPTTPVSYPNTVFAKETNATPSAMTNHPKPAVTKAETVESPAAKSNTIPNEPAASVYNMFIPNAFSPNGDGINDIFKVAADFTISNFEMTIFSRSGDRIFTTRNYENGWTGEKYGSIMQEGIYLYVIKYTDPEGQSQMKKGQVLLIK